METHRERIRSIVQVNPDLVDFTEGDPEWRDYTIWDMADSDYHFSKLGWLAVETERLRTCFPMENILDGATVEDEGSIPDTIHLPLEPFYIEFGKSNELAIGSAWIEGVYVWREDQGNRMDTRFVFVQEDSRAVPEDIEAQIERLTISASLTKRSHVPLLEFMDGVDDFYATPGFVLKDVLPRATSITAAAVGHLMESQPHLTFDDHATRVFPAPRRSSSMRLGRW